MADNSPIIRNVSKRLAGKVREMRRAQRDYFNSPPGDSKQRHLGMAKRLEQEVDQMLHNFEQTIDNL